MLRFTQPQRQQGGSVLKHDHAASTPRDLPRDRQSPRHMGDPHWSQTVVSLARRGAWFETGTPPFTPTGYGFPDPVTLGRSPGHPALADELLANDTPLSMCPPIYSSSGSKYSGIQMDQKRVQRTCALDNYNMECLGPCPRHFLSTLQGA
jgi:hypothetical protein